MAPKEMPSSSSLLVEQQQQRRQQQHQESDTGDMEVSSCEENNAIARNGTTNKHTEEGYFLRWSRIRKTVEISDNSGGLMRGSIAGGGGAAQNRRLKSSLFFQSATSSSTPATNKKDILCQVSGYAAPGQILAVMGPSGSGKTSLLNTLSGRSSYQAGVLSINGERLTHATMKKIMSKTAYVKQADIFFEHLTVQDQLTYTALLKLPQSMPRDEMHREVQRIITLLRLNKVKESPISMCSGGEKKRVNIGTELLTDPKLILLDEPTSGLDSTSAVSLLKLLSSLARDEGKTVVTTIHQPSSQVFRSFDRLCMISDGYVVYFGNPVDSLDYLRTQGLACPDGYNAADHWMDLLVKENLDDDNDNDQRDGEIDVDQKKNLNNGNNNHGKSPRFQLQMAWDGEAVAEQMDAQLKDHDTSSEKSELLLQQGEDGSGKRKKHVSKYNTSWLTQYKVLIHRSLKNSRSSIFTPLNMVKSVAIGVVAGLIWWQMPYEEKYVSDRSSWFFFTMTFWIFDSMFNALMAFPAEKVVILKERASASYHLSAYFMAKTTSDAPVRLVLPFLYMTTSFWMAGIDHRFGVFIASTGCTLLGVLAGESLGLLVGALFSAMDQALTVMTVFTLALMLLGGFFVENIPDFVKWARYLSPFKYAFDGSLQFVFDRDVPCDGSGALENLCRGSTEGVAKSSDVLDTLGVQGTVTFNVLLLAVICLFPRYLAYLALRRQKGVERS